MLLDHVNYLAVHLLLAKNALGEQILGDGLVSGLRWSRRGDTLHPQSVLMRLIQSAIRRSFVVCVPDLLHVDGAVGFVLGD